ncbi:putative acylesterase/phospholipase RssA [Rhizobium sp. PP-F2F-G36]|nr:putative acylesterase/phospholipase RssA [Rhizobium sp. PP-F2F-G36]
MSPPPCKITPDDQIFLCLSGGGLRATFFHLGVIRSLRKNGLLGSVTAVCAVSGGSITAAHLIDRWQDFTGADEAFEAACKKLLSLGQRDIRGRIVRRWILSFRWIGYGRVRGLAKEYATFFGRKKIADLYRPLPDAPAGSKPPALYLMATSFTTGHLCSFSGEGFSTLFDDGIKDVPADLINLDMAIAASSAFPPLFPPMRLTREDVAGDPVSFPVPAIYLTDGGVYDNLGIERCITLIKEGSPGTVIVVSDAGGAFNWDETSGFSSLISRTVRTTDILMRNAALETIRSLAAREGLRVLHVPINATTSKSPLPLQVQTFIKQIRTDLDRFSPAESALLMVHGETVTDAMIVDMEPLPVSLPLALSKVSADRMANTVKAARRRSYNILNFRDVATYLLLALPVIVLTSVGVIYYVGTAKIVEMKTAEIVAENIDVQANADANSQRVEDLKQQLVLADQTSSPQANARDAYTVFIQFAGFKRPDVVKMATTLVEAGWTVPAPDKGGERLGSASGRNEVRIGLEDDRAFAEQLAEDVLKSGLLSKKPVVKIYSTIPSRNLELWISP